MGGPPAPNLVRTVTRCASARQSGATRSIKDFDQRIASTEATRAEMQQGFGRPRSPRPGIARQGATSAPAAIFDRLVRRARPRRQVDQPRIQAAQSRQRRARFVGRYAVTAKPFPAGLSPGRVLALSLLIPGWAAGALGLARSRGCNWISRTRASFIALLLLCDLLGLCIWSAPPARSMSGTSCLSARWSR
jgi:hypothetical protein